MAVDIVLVPSSPVLPIAAEPSILQRFLGGQTVNAPLVHLYVVLPACWEAQQDALSQTMPAMSYRKI